MSDDNNTTADAIELSVTGTAMDSANTSNPNIDFDGDVVDLDELDIEVEDEGEDPFQGLRPTPFYPTVDPSAVRPNVDIMRRYLDMTMRVSIKDGYGPGTCY